MDYKDTHIHGCTYGKPLVPSLMGVALYVLTGDHKKNIKNK